MGDITGYQNPIAAADPDITLHVEGLTDKQVIEERWLAQSPALRGKAFSAVVEGSREGGERSRSNGGSGGSTAVISRLRDALHDNETIAMGLVDRDYLLGPGKVDAMLECNDDLFGECVAGVIPEDLNQRLWVLPRWELENYLLLDLDDLRQELVDRPGPKHQPPDSSEQLAARLLSLAKVNQPRVLAMLWCAQNNRDHVKVKNPGKIRDASGMHTAVTSQEDGPTPDNLKEFEALVGAFENGNTPAERWYTASRIVDGKWMLSRISRDWSSNKSADLRRGLASRGAQRHAGPPPEVVSILDKMRRSALRLSRTKG